MEGKKLPFEKNNREKKTHVFFCLEGWKKTNKKNTHKTAGVSGLMEFMKK